MSEKRYREMKWDCGHCGTKAVLGHIRSCPNCGKDRDVQCYLVPEDNNIVTNPKELKEAQAGPDWQCGKCGHFNTASMLVCEQCGAAKSEGTENKRVHYGPGEKPTANDTPQQQEASPSRMAWRADPKQDYTSDIMETTPPVTKPEQTSLASSINLDRLIGPLLGLFAIAVILLSVWFLFIRKINVAATVSGFSWTRMVVIEKYAWVADSNLTGYPAGSRNQHNNWEIIGHHEEVSGSHTEFSQECKSVADGETCRTTDEGNGYASESCSTNYTEECEKVPHTVTDYRTVADYGWRYYFEIQRWIPSRSPQTTGTDRNPMWPDFTLATTQEPERETGRAEHYVIQYLGNDKKSYTRDVSLEEWKGYDENGVYTLTLNGVGTILDITKTGENNMP